MTEVKYFVSQLFMDILVIKELHFNLLVINGEVWTILFKTNLHNYDLVRHFLQTIFINLLLICNHTLVPGCRKLSITNGDSLNLQRTKTLNKTN